MEKIFSFISSEEGYHIVGLVRLIDLTHDQDQRPQNTMQTAESLPDETVWYPMNVSKPDVV